MNIFLSSSAADRKLAAKLFEALQRQGLAVGPDPKILESGTKIRRHIDDALRAADLIVVLVRPDNPDDTEQLIWPEVLSAVWDDPSKTILPLLLNGAAIPPFIHSSSRDLAAIRIADPADPRQIETAAASVKLATVQAARENAPEHRRDTKVGFPLDPVSEIPPKAAETRDVRMREIERFVETLKERG